MANTPNNFFPYLSPPPPPSHPIHPPPPPPAVKPPPPAVKPPPPHSPPPPPPPHIHPSPPPPHVHPPPSIPPPVPPPGPTFIVIVFISFGGVFFLAFLAVALFCFLKKRKKKSVQETDLIHVDEHKKIKEQIVKGPHGVQDVVLSIEDDIHVDEVIKKNETETFGKGLDANPSSIGISGPASSAGSDDDDHQHHHNEHKT